MPPSKPQDGHATAPAFPPGKQPDLKPVVDLLAITARLLFTNGQTTIKTITALERLGERLGFPTTAILRWEEIILRIEDDRGSHYEIFSAGPAVVDIRKVIATMDVVDRVCDGRLDAAQARSELARLDRLPPISILRFALMAGAGAAALGAIYGADLRLSLVLIAISGAVGALFRRWLAEVSRNLFVQPFFAALLAGLGGALVIRWNITVGGFLIAVCPAMILVPGPHLLNGAIDLARGRIALGAARMGYAGMIVLMICAGLHVGLTLCGVSLPPAYSARPVPLVYDTIAAGVAVAAFGTFFSMPWRLLPIPIAIGMLAHALRWLAISRAGASVELGALIACLAVGLITTPVANRLHLPFAGVAFASVVSLMPGVFLFKFAGGVVSLVRLGAQAPHELLVQVMNDASTALLIFMAMAFGLIVPKLTLDHFPRFVGHD